MSKRFYADLEEDNVGDSSTIVTKTVKLAKKQKVPHKNMSVNAMVKKAMLKLAETKTQCLTTNQFINPATGSGWAALGIRPVTPYSSGVSIIGGTGQGDRIGNKIRTKKVTMDFCLYSNPYNGTTNLVPQPMEIAFWVCSVKEENTLPTSLNDFFQNGNTTSGLAGTLADYVKSVNTDKYTVHRQFVKKLGFADYGGTGATGSQPLFGNYANNDYKLNHNFTLDLTKYCPKNIVWNDSGNPTSKVVFIVMEAIPANGAGIAIDQLPASMYWNLEYQFTDL